MSESFIPLAINADRIADDAAGRFFRDIIKQSHLSQGIWVVTPEGKILSSHYFKAQNGESPRDGQARWVSETLAMVKDGIAAAGPLKARDVKPQDPFPDRGVGVRKDGGVRPAVFCRFLDKGRRDGTPVVDSFVMPAKEWLAFSPPKPEVGTEWTIPEAAVKRFAPALGPIPDSIYAPLPADVTEMKLTARIESIDGGRCSIRFTGMMQSEHFRDGDKKLPIRVTATIEGVGSFDQKQNQVSSLLLYFRGSYRTVPPYDKPRPFGAVIEWQRK